MARVTRRSTQRTTTRRPSARRTAKRKSADPGRIKRLLGGARTRHG